MRSSIVKGIVSIFLAGILAAGICCAGFASRDENGKWFGNVDISTWHWKDNVAEESSAEAVTIAEDL